MQNIFTEFSRDSSFGIATRYGRDGPEIESAGPSDRAV